MTNIFSENWFIESFLTEVTKKLLLSILVSNMGIPEEDIDYYLDQRVMDNKGLGINLK